MWIGRELEASPAIDERPVELVGELLVAGDPPMDPDIPLAARRGRGDLVDGDLRCAREEARDAEARSDPAEQQAGRQAGDDAEADEPEGNHGGMVAQDSERPGGTVTTAWASM
jgi:hypothetical protein